MSQLLMQLHNISQVAMWSIILIWLFLFCNFSEAYSNKGWRTLFNCAQTMQILDFVFSALKWVKNNTIQVITRQMIMLILIYCVFPVCGACIWLSLVVVALGITEVIRYAFYTGYAKEIVGTLRYNVFLVIIPFNQFTEFMTCY